VPTLRCGDATLYFERHRAPAPACRSPLLFIMGHGADLEGWRPQIDHFAQSHDLIVYDHRGVGRSPRPRLPRYGIPRLADDAARLLDAMGVGGAHVVGISLGGLVAQQLAIRHPHHVASLTLAATYAKPSAHLGRDVARIMGRTALEIARGSLRGADPLERETDAFMRAWAPAAFSEPFLRVHADLVRREVRRTLQSNRRADVALLQLHAILRYDARAELGRIRAPTWIVAGTLDRHVPTALARELAAGIAGARLDIWEVGHSLTFEAADRFNAALEQFVGDVERAREAQG
jgi:pimeloyl-ACP methyl ester carboxylesterase